MEQFESGVSAVTKSCLAVGSSLINYSIIDKVADGSFGSVYKAQRTDPESSNRDVALKFFGYTSVASNWVDINDEVMKMIYLSGTSGAIQIIGLFYDSKEGILMEKKFHEAFPVIVMECLSYKEEGSPKVDKFIVDFVRKQRQPNESDLQGKRKEEATSTAAEEEEDKKIERDYIDIVKLQKKIFREIIISLQGIHSKGFIHCDISQNNIMIVDADEKTSSLASSNVQTDPLDDFKIKVIDFGSMKALDNNQTPTKICFVEDCGVGRTESSWECKEQCPTLDRHVYKYDELEIPSTYHAPEMKFTKEYSYRSDVWQCGVILKEILTGFSSRGPFFRVSDADFRYYFGTMCEACYNNYLLSYLGDNDTQFGDDDSRDLLQKLLCRDPTRRITLDKVLDHAWLRDSTQEGLVSPPAKQITKIRLQSYRKNIKTLECRKELANILKVNLMERGGSKEIASVVASTGERNSLKAEDTKKIRDAKKIFLEISDISIDVTPEVV
jgi:serine/threonine protein kinase